MYWTTDLSVTGGGKDYKHFGWFTKQFFQLCFEKVS